jgi:hypothetical protein
MSEVKSPVVVAAPAPKVKVVHAMRAVHGLLIHPYTHTRFNTDKALDHELDGWCAAQIEAKKLEIV